MRPAVTGSERYRRTDALGEDELGALWRGTDVRSGAPVTVRVLDERLTSDSQAAERVAARLQRVLWNASNPHLPRVLELRLTERPAIAVTEGSGRETLARHLERVGALSTRRALRVVAAVADGLAGAHDVWVSHGALSPSSVLVDELVVAKVVDVGLGELLVARDDGRRVAHATNLTDRRAADVLAVGLLFERLVSGPEAHRPPSEVDAPRAWEAEVTAEIRAVLRRALSPHWLQRPGMAELAATLAPALAATDEDEPVVADAARFTAPRGPDASGEDVPPLEPGLPAPPRPDRSVIAAAAGAETSSPRPARPVSEALEEPQPREAIRRGRRRRRVVLVALLSTVVVIGASVGAFLALRDTGGGRHRPVGSGAASPSAATSVTPSVTAAPQPATVPAVLGVRVEAATELLQQAGLVVGSVTTVPGRAGVVVRSEPTQGEAVAAGTAVNLFVGNGAEA